MASSVAPKLKSIGYLPVRSGSMKYPTGITVDKYTNTLYIVGRECDDILVFNISEQRFEYKVGASLSEDTPRHVILSTSLNLFFVSESYTDQILAFRTSDGALAFKFGSPGKRTNKFLYPNEMALDEKTNRLFISDCNNNRISVHQCTTGKFICYIGVDDLKQPHGIVFDNATDTLYVGDSGHGRILVYQSSTGALLRILELGGSKDYNLGYITGIAIDITTNTLFVADFTGNQLLMFRLSDGIFLSVIKDFDGPQSVTVNSTTKTVYVVDEDNHQIQMFKIK